VRYGLDDTDFPKHTVSNYGVLRGTVKSISASAVAGATGNEWFGLSVHRRFKTMIIQTENGLFRLSKEFSDLDCDVLESYVRICPPPPWLKILGMLQPMLK
jgi:hypothetical protein